MPTSDSGTATLGMMVAYRLRRNRKITITTSATVSISSNSTSFTDAWIGVVRSVSVVTVDALRQVRFQLRQQALDALHHADGVAARLPLHVQDDRRVCVAGAFPYHAACVVFSTPSTILATSVSITGAPLR